MKTKNLKTLGYVCTAIGFVLTFAQKKVESEEFKKTVSEEVKRQLDQQQ